MMKRITIAALLALLAVAAAYRPIQEGRARIVRTVAARLMEPVIAAQSADASEKRSEMPAEAVTKPPCPKAGTKPAVILVKAKARHTCDLDPHA